MPWATRGLSEGVVTTHYPHRPDGYDSTFRSTVVVAAGTGTKGEEDLERLCPSGAIRLRTDRASSISVDRGRCISCGRCVARRPDVSSFDSTVETAACSRGLLVVPHVEEDMAELVALRASLARRTRLLRRSVHVRHVDCGSDGSEEWEIAALANPVYDVQRLGVFFTASPRHADVLLVTGAGSAGMLEPLLRTYEAMPSPKVVVAVGTDAASGGLLLGSYAVRGGVSETLPIDVYVPGSPPSPFSILHGILLATGLLDGQADKRRQRSRRGEG